MKSGFIAIIGRSNVGKSSILNSLIGTKVSIVTNRAQTTRLPVQGILNDARGQAVFVDTPGLLHETHDRLTKKLNDVISQVIQEIDLILYVVDPTRAIGNEEYSLLKLVENIPTAKKILVINKADLKEQPFKYEYQGLASKFGQVLEISAYNNRGLEALKDLVFEALPEGEILFPDGQFTTLDNRVWLSELIREKVFYYLHDELPYGIKINVLDVTEEEGLLKIDARIVTNDENHKGMIIGLKGRKIKEIGTAARKELEAILGQKVFLKLEVEVDPDWQRLF
ncbi:MAG: GTPase Era [bacterium]